MHADKDLIRSLSERDAAAVSALGDESYGAALYESLECVRRKLSLFPQGCFGCWHDQSLCAYIISLPWRRAEILALNSIVQLPHDADCLYVHDLAVRGDVRRQGIGRRLAERVIELGRELGFSSCTLVAVQNSEPFWEKMGFRQFGTCGYGGAAAVKMERGLQHDKPASA